MEFPAAAVERAMTYQQVIMRALAGTWTWLKAADVLGLHPRSLRRWRARYALSYIFVKLALQEAGFVPTGAPGAATGGGASPAPASASCCTSTAVTTSGSRSVPGSGRRSSRSSTTPPSGCAMPSSGPRRRRTPC